MSDRPAISIAINDRIRDEQIASILNGIEEEQVPAEITRTPELNPLKLAHQASTASRLGIGVGISLEYIVITTEKLAVDIPYLVSSLNQSVASDRAAGANAARLVKRLPLVALTKPSASELED